MAAEGRGRDLHRWAQTLAGLGIVLAAIAGVLGALLGPLVVEIAFGADFRPSGMFAGLVAAGVVAAATGMFLGQVLVARGETMRLALAWVVAVLAGALALLLPIDDVEVLVGVAFLVGEAVAVAVLATWALRPSAAPVPAD
jgi:O-antigen/teichoic acid export membrane protein